MFKVVEVSFIHKPSSCTDNEVTESYFFDSVPNTRQLRDSLKLTKSKLTYLDRTFYDTIYDNMLASLKMKKVKKIKEELKNPLFFQYTFQAYPAWPEKAIIYIKVTFHKVKKGASSCS